MHHGTVLKTLLLLLSVVTGLHRILGQNSFFFLTDAIASFIGHYGVAQDSRSEFYFFFVTDTIASVIGYYGVAEDSGSKSFFFKKNGPTVQFDRIPIQSHAYCKRPIHQFFQ